MQQTPNPELIKYFRFLATIHVRMQCTCCTTSIDGAGSIGTFLICEASSGHRVVGRGRTCLILEDNALLINCKNQSEKNNCIITLKVKTLNKDRNSEK